MNRGEIGERKKGKERNDQLESEVEFEYARDTKDTRFSRKPEKGRWQFFL